MRQARIATGMTMQELGNAIRTAYQQQQEYEMGVNRIGASRLFDIAQILGVRISFDHHGQGRFPPYRLFQCVLHGVHNDIGRWMGSRAQQAQNVL